MKVWIEGEIVDGAEAKIPVIDHGLLYGDGIFEGMRIINRRVFRLDDHLRRLAVSARAIGLNIPVSRAALQELVLDTARAFGQDEAYIRLLVTRGDGELGVDPTRCEQPRIICIVDHIQLFPADKSEHGIALITASLRRPGADVLDPRVKSLNYLNSVLAKREARLRGADEALILNQAGMVAEASVANVFAVMNGVLLTPPLSDGALGGITRSSVLECARTAGIEIRETTLGRYDLLASDEVFLTGTAARIVPVASLDGQVIGWGGERAVTDRLRELLAEFSRHNGVRF